MLSFPKRRARRQRARRREAASLVLEQHDQSAAELTQVADELADEVLAMRSLSRSLDRLSASAWTAALGPELPARSIAGRARTHTRAVRTAWATGALAACLAGAFFLGALSHPFLQHTRHRLPALSTTVILHPLPGQSNSATAVAYMSPSDRMLVRVHGLSPSAPGTFYELWLMTSNTDLVPVASFKIGASGSARLALVVPASPARYRYLDVSLQQLSAGTAISANSVLRGRI